MKKKCIEKKTGEIKNDIFLLLLIKKNMHLDCSSVFDQFQFQLAKKGNHPDKPCDLYPTKFKKKKKFAMNIY